MKWYKFFIILIIVTLAVSGFKFNYTNASNIKVDISQQSIIVKFRNEIKVREIFLTKNQAIDKMIAYYSALPNVEYAEPNYVVSAAMVPADTYFSNQWYLKRIKALEAWNINNKSQNIIIAIVDSGVQISHPDIKSNLWLNTSEIQNNKKDDDKNGLIDDIYGWDFVNNTADPSPKFNPGFTESGVIHGTVIAGIAAASGDNNQGITGVTWQSKIMALKALDDQGNGNMSAVIKSVDYAVAKGANIINLSFVGFNYSRALEEAIIRARQAGVIVVAPAGNEQATIHGLNLNQKPAYPACYLDRTGKKLVIGVAATDGIDQKTNFSGYGSNCIDIAAPGISFYSTSVYAPNKSSAGKFFNQYYDGYWSGTSMAVPVVSGVIALIQGTNPNLSSDEVINILLSSSDDINQLNPEYLSQLGAGRVNAAQAVLEAALKLKNRRAQFFFAPAANDKALVSVTDSGGNKEKEFLVYKEDFLGGINLAAGDFNADGNEEVVVAPLNGLEASIKIFNSDGKLLNNFLAYPYNFKGGVNIATADIDGDGKSEIITAPRAGFEPIVKIFKPDGKLIRSFLAYPASFKGGVAIASANVSGDRKVEIVTAPGKGGIPQIKVFSNQGLFLNSFLVGSRNENYGFNLALADLDSNPRRLQAEIIISRQSGSPLVATYDFRGNKRNQWLAYAAPFTGNVGIMAADLNRNGFTDIITIPASSGGPHVRVFNYRGEFERSFYAYSSDFNNGLAAAVLLTNN